MNTQYGLVYVTTKNQEEARKIARLLIQKRLIACANILSPIVSCYKWKGKYIEEKEVVLILKTQKDLFKTLKESLLEVHSYETPCIVFIPISKGHEPFLSWISSQL